MRKNNMKTMKVITTLVLMMAACTLHAQKTPKEITDKFMETYTTLPAMALRFAFMDPMCAEKIQEQEDALVARANTFPDIYGFYYGHELLSEEKVGESVIIYTYLVKYQCQPIELKLVLYNAKDEWDISNIYINSIGN